MEERSRLSDTENQCLHNISDSHGVPPGGGGAAGIPGTVFILNLSESIPVFRPGL